MALTIPVSEIVEKSSNRLIGKHESWGRVLLGDVAAVLNGFAFKSSEFSNSGGMPLIRIRDVGKNRSETTYLGEYDPRYVVEAGDLLVGMDGDFNCARWCGPRGLLNQRVCKITLKSDIYLAKFLDYTLPGYLKAINDVTSSVTVKHLSSKSIEEIPLPLPPKEVQQILVAEIEKQFSRLDEAVANLKRVKANLKRYKAAVLKAAVEGKFVSCNPSGWTRTNLGTVLTTIETGKSFKCEERLPNIREIGVVKVSAVTWGTYNEEESKTCLDPDRIETRYFVKPGDFLFSRANTIQLVGACVIAQKVNRKIMLSDKILRFHFSDMTVPQWVLYWLRSDIGRKEIQRLSTGNQESMRNIGQERIRQIAFALPVLEEQRAIVAEVERRLSVIEELEAAVEVNLIRADRLRQSVLARAFSGELTTLQ